MGGEASSEMMGNWTVMDENSFKKNRKDWKAISAVAVGQVFKVEHCQWKKDVAVKLIGRDDGYSKEKLVREAELMLRAEGPYIVKVLGVFKGCTPFSPLMKVGLVMELMERGSLDSLQYKREHQPLPWPLVFRLVHQVAEGMNDLHSLKPDALIHKDLKHENIMLDADLNVKIDDFGLAEFAQHVTTCWAVQGMDPLLYARPEAAYLSPEEAPQGGATTAYDVYSYAVMVWTLLHPGFKIPSYKRFDVSEGVTSLEKVRRMNVPGLEELAELLERCWRKDCDQRPTFAECIAVTGSLYSKYGWSGKINDAVRQVQQELDGDLVPGAASVPCPDPGQDQPAPGPNTVNNELGQDLKVMMDEKNWTVMDGNSFEGKWDILGSGGGGQVLKTRHSRWEKDVAVKLLFRDDGSSSEEDLLREAKAMLRAESPYIVKVLGVFNGCTPRSPITTVGLVMELMEKGSLESLQIKKRQRKPLPWPLVFRLVHQVAEGMNDLHSLKPDALIHKDLKLDNILLDADLNVKITDFGIAKFEKSLTAKPLQGMCTAFYSPPEAPQGGATTAYDVYSYAIVVWTILNPAYIIGINEQSYPTPTSTRERPSLVDVRKLKAPGLEELVDLMVRCWRKDCDQRPTFAECTAVTARLYEKNQRGINDAVRKVQQELVKKA